MVDKKKAQVDEKPKYELNQLRERAQRLPEITDEIWLLLEINEENREVIEEFLEDGCRNLSPKTVKQYRSALRIYAKYTMDNLKNKPFYKLKKKSFLKYQNWLQDHGLSSAGIRLKRAAVSSLYRYCENFLAEEDDNWETFRNYIPGIPAPTKTKTYEKVPITEEEFVKIKKYFTRQKRYRDYAIVVTLMRTGMRIGELRQLKRTEALKVIPEGKKFIKTDYIRGKGRGIQGKNVTYLLTKEVLLAIKLWSQERGEDNGEYLFTTQYRKGDPTQISENYFSNICQRELSPLLGRRINPHLFRGSAATYFLEQGLDIKSVKNILNHESVETTSSFYDLRDEDEMLNDELDKIL